MRAWRGAMKALAAVVTMAQERRGSPSAACHRSQIPAKAKTSRPETRIK